MELRGGVRFFLVFLLVILIKKNFGFVLIYGFEIGENDFLKMIIVGILCFYFICG